MKSFAHFRFRPSFILLEKPLVWLAVFEESSARIFRRVSTDCGECEFRRRISLRFRRVAAEQTGERIDSIRPRWCDIIVALAESSHGLFASLASCDSDYRLLGPVLSATSVRLRS